MKVFIVFFFIRIITGHVDDCIYVDDCIDVLFQRFPVYRGLRDILLEGLIDDDILIKSYYLKITQMRIGSLWEKLFVIEGGFEKLPQGLDLIHRERKIVIELKNSWNSDNFNSRITTFNKLSDYKLQHPDYTSVYANINGRNDIGTNHHIVYAGQDIYHITGNELLQYIFGDGYSEIIDRVKEKLRVKFQTLHLL
jgi:hypothetical protein